MKQNKDFLSFINERIETSKKFTEENFINRQKMDVKLYNAKHTVVKSTTTTTDDGDIVSRYNVKSEKRYNFPDRLIFTNTEAGKADMFERLPDLIIKSRNESSQEKRQLINGVYEYLKDKLDLLKFAYDSAHLFILSGFTIAFVDYKSVKKDIPVYNEESREPEHDEEGNPLIRTGFEYDDPIVVVGDPLKNYYSPSSKYSINMSDVPYNIREHEMEVDKIKEVYKVDVDANVVEKDDSGDDKQDPTRKLATVYFFTGTIPEKFKKNVKDWELDAEYFIVSTKDKLLFSKRRNRRQSKLVAWYKQPNEFFGYGFGQIGKPYQEQIEQRKSQLSRSADVSAYAKLIMKNDGEETTNPEKYKDPRANLVIPYTANKPEYLKPPVVGDSVMVDMQNTESSAQAAFGMLDLSVNSQQAGAKTTATAQTYFIEASKARIKYAKRIFMKFYRDVIIELFKQCQENWEEEKTITVTDEDGNTEEKQITKKDLADIDFDKDLDIDPETVSVNKDVVREQFIALYDKTKDDPMVNREVLFKDMLKRGFSIVNPDRYIKDQETQNQEAMDRQSIESGGMPGGTPGGMPGDMPRGMPEGIPQPLPTPGSGMPQGGEGLPQPTPGGGRVAQSQAAVLNKPGV